MAKQFGWRLLVVAAAVGLVLSSTGCASTMALIGQLFNGGVKMQQTADSRFLHEKANDILLEKEDGVLPTQFGPLFSRRVQGAPTETSNTENTAEITYKGKQFRMTFSNVNQYKAGKEIIYWVSATGCFEFVKKE